MCMCVCVYTYMCERALGVHVCVRVCMYTYMHICIYIRTNSYLSLPLSQNLTLFLAHTNMHVGAFSYVFVSMYACIFVCIFVPMPCMYLCISLHFCFVRMHVCIYIHIKIYTQKRTYTHTHKHIHIHTPGDAMSHRDGLGREVVLSACPVCSRVAAPKKKDTLSCQKSPII